MYVVFAEEDAKKPPKTEVVNKKMPFANQLTILIILGAVTTCVFQVVYQYWDLIRTW